MMFLFEICYEKKIAVSSLSEIRLCPPVSFSTIASNKLPIKWHCVPHLIQGSSTDSSNQITLLPSQLHWLVIFVHPRCHNGTVSIINASVIHPHEIDRVLHRPCFTKRRPSPERAVACKCGWLKDGIDTVFSSQLARQFGIPNVGAN